MSAQAPWKADIAPYAQASVPRSVVDLLTSVVPYLALMALQMWMLESGVSFWAVLPIAIPTAGFLLRTFIVFHDCTHGSFMPTKRGNHLLGACVGLLVFTPFQTWRHSHAMHHATAGDLDRRGQGDVPTMTLEEYEAHDWPMRLGYRLFRNPVVMFGLGWLWGLVIQPRLVSKDARPRLKRSTWITNLVLALVVTGLCLLVGPGTFFGVQGPAAALAGATGVFLFYVQHQFEDTYWENNATWSYTDAALRGSSYLKLPQPFQFFTGNIGLHHVHHLSARVPNYNLQAAVDNVALFDSVPVLSFWDGVKASRLKVWSADHGRLLTWGEVRALRQVGMPATATTP
ncbi:MAG: fatty acid desaturase [Solirubrobacteraceae bacterium]